MKKRNVKMLNHILCMLLTTLLFAKCSDNGTGGEGGTSGGTLTINVTAPASNNPEYENFKQQSHLNINLGDYDIFDIYFRQGETIVKASSEAIQGNTITDNGNKSTISLTIPRESIDTEKDYLVYGVYGLETRSSGNKILADVNFKYVNGDDHFAIPLLFEQTVRKGISAVKTLVQQLGLIQAVYLANTTSSSLDLLSSTAVTNEQPFLPTWFYYSRTESFNYDLVGKTVESRLEAPAELSRIVVNPGETVPIISWALPKSHEVLEYKVALGVANDSGSNLTLHYTNDTKLARVQMDEVDYFPSYVEWNGTELLWSNEITLNPLGGDRFYPRVQSSALFAADDLRGDIIPDYSRIGYQWGDKEIPTVPVVKTVTPPSDPNADAWELIQSAINDVSILPANQRGAILLKAGRYRVSKPLRITASGIVLRGEGYGEDASRNTILYATGTSKYDLIEIGGAGGTTPKEQYPQGLANIIDEYVPVGRFWVQVNNPSNFKVGDDVVVYRPYSDQWIADIRMNQIYDPQPNTVMWHQQPNDYTLIAERVITMIIGDTLHFDNPIVMSIDKNRYGAGAVYKYSSYNRVSECGVENMLLHSWSRNATDEDHGWNAIIFSEAEHSWVRNVHAKNFGYSLVTIDIEAKHITIKDCEFREGHSPVVGGYRYSFNNRGSLSLVIDCSSYDSRHDYSTGGIATLGPNAFVNSKAYRVHSDIGPHERWDVGTLYDNIITEGSINVQDRGSFGSGHGWAGANQVLWNCIARNYIMQTPQVSATNFAIGCIGDQVEGARQSRINGIWISHGVPVTPRSLYHEQLSVRRQAYPGGVFSIRSK